MAITSSPKKRVSALQRKVFAPTGTRRKVHRRFTAVAAAVALTASVAPAVASAGVDHWFSGGLGGAQAYSSGQVHTWSRIEGDTSTGSSGWCVARLSGAGGLITSPGSSFCDAYPSFGQAIAYYGGGTYHALANDYGAFSQIWTTATHGTF